MRAFIEVFKASCITQTVVVSRVERCTNVQYWSWTTCEWKMYSLFVSK